MANKNGASMIAQPDEGDDEASILTLLPDVVEFDDDPAGSPSGCASAGKSQSPSSNSSSSSASGDSSDSVARAKEQKRAERASRREEKQKRKAERAAKREAKKERKVERAAKKEAHQKRMQAAQEEKKARKEAREEVKRKRKLVKAAWSKYETPKPKHKAHDESRQGSFTKWFPDKGYGIIQPLERGPDVMCNMESFKSGKCDVRPDGLVTYTIKEESGKVWAVNVDVVRNTHGTPMVHASWKRSKGGSPTKFW